MALIPFVQIPAIVALAVLPSARAEPLPETASTQTGSVASITRNCAVSYLTCMVRLTANRAVGMESYGAF